MTEYSNYSNDENDAGKTLPFLLYFHFLVLSLLSHEDSNDKSK